VSLLKPFAASALLLGTLTTPFVLTGCGQQTADSQICHSASEAQTVAVTLKDENVNNYMADIGVISANANLAKDKKVRTDAQGIAQLAATYGAPTKGQDMVVGPIGYALTPLSDDCQNDSENLSQ
jgi:hypothetical protein